MARPKTYLKHLIHVLGMLGVLGDMFSPIIYVSSGSYIYVIQLIIFQHLFKLRSKIKFENHINNDELLENHMRSYEGD
jgi:hypothetical protein